MTQEFWNC